MRIHRLIVLILSLLSIAGSAYSQDYPYYDKNWKDTIPESKPEVKPVEQQTKSDINLLDEEGTMRLMINIGQGSMNSAEINQYIYEDLRARGLTINSGSPDMTSVLLIGTQIGYAVKPRLIVRGIFDFAIGISATEVIGSAQNDFVTYTATRLSFGAGGNYYFGKRKVTPYVGLAILYHAISFEGFKGGTVGPRGELGAAFNFSDKFKMEGFLQGDIAETEAKNLTKPMNVDLSTFNIGARFLFRIN